MISRRSLLKSSLLWIPSIQFIIRKSTAQGILTYYVNTGTAGSPNTPGGDGTTNATSGTSRAFASTREAILSLYPSEPTPLTNPTIFDCSGELPDTLNVIQTHWNRVGAYGDNYLLLQGDNRSGVWDDTKYRWEVSDQSVIYNNHPSALRLDALQGQITSTTGGDANVFRGSTLNVATGDIRMSNCIARAIISSGANNITGFRNSPYSGGGGQTRLWNCIAYDCENGFETDRPETIHYNCTAYNNISNYVGAMVCINCISDEGANGFNSVGTGGGASKNNASHDGTAPGANSRINQDFLFVNEAGRLFQLQNTDTGAKGFGFEDPASGLFTDDIADAERTNPWDIGAWKAAAAAVSRNAYGHTARVGSVRAP